MGGSNRKMKCAISPEQKRALLMEALEARKNSYCPYSGFAVGAALLTKSGRIYRGANIENASFGLTNCAERTAIFSAVSQGEKEFTAIAIAGAARETEPKEPCMPCGSCRQVMAEFTKPDCFEIITGGAEGELVAYSLSELLPHCFGSELETPLQ